MKSILSKFGLLFTFFMGLAALIGFLSPEDEFMVTHQNKLLEETRQNADEYFKSYADERVYVQTDKPFYQPGEAIWFTAFLREEAELKASDISDIVRFELVNPKGNSEKKIKVIAKGGIATADFQLDEAAPGGLYKLKAYTEWQKNDTNNLLFEKEITVQTVILPRLKMSLDFQKKAYGPGDKVMADLELNQNDNTALAFSDFKFVAQLNGNTIGEYKASTNREGKAVLEFKLPSSLNTNDGLVNVLIDYEGQVESISRSIPIVLNKIGMKFYPEGGDLVQGLKSRVAFAATNEFGKGADIDGVVIDDQGNQVAKFSSIHMGMGSFNFKPEKGRTYEAKITRPEGVKGTYELPEALKMGYVMKVESKDKGLALEINSSVEEELSVVGRIHGRIAYTGAINANAGLNRIMIPTQKMPIGIMQVTLFDGKGIARAERLAFINKDRQLNIKVSTEKEKYLPREKVVMTIETSDERGIPMPADLAVSVVDDQLLSFADDKQGNILSKMLLEPELNGKVEEAAFYFDPKEVKANIALDHLLMTRGYRKFGWETISTPRTTFAFQPESAAVTGYVRDAYTGKPIENAKVYVFKTRNYTVTDSTGLFRLKGVDITEHNKLEVTADNYDRSYQQVYNYNQQVNVALVDPAAMTKYYEDNVVLDAMMIEEVEIAAVQKRGLGAINLAAPAMPKVAKKKVKRADMVERMEEPMDEPDEAIKENKDLRDNKNGNDDLLGVEGELGIQNHEEEEFNLMGDITTADKRINLNQGIEAGNFILYRTREFEAPQYKEDEVVEVRSDFRSTVFWKGHLKIGKSGKTTIEFFNNDKISSFRTTIEGLGPDGSIGRAEHVHFTQLPFSMSTKFPIEVAMGDRILVPFTLKNNMPNFVKGNIDLQLPDGLALDGAFTTFKSLTPNMTNTWFIPIKVENKPGKGKIRLAFEFKGTRDVYEQEIKIVEKGFPVKLSLSGDETEAYYQININKPIDGTLQAKFTAYPSALNEMISGLESILREPYGCFEQTSSSTYPNIMVLQYMKETGQDKKNIRDRAEGLIKKGYKRLTSFETKEKGYEWFGAAPAHEALTAYGLMEFNDMKEVYPSVSTQMIDRTAKYLMGRKDGKGGFKRNSKALDRFGRASDRITNGYIVYALSEAGYTDIKKEANTAYEQALDSKDPYAIGMAANTMFNLGETAKAEKAVEELLKRQVKNGSFKGATESITRSGGLALDIETTAIGAMALMKSNTPKMMQLNNAMGFMAKSRTGGGFRSTQATVLALKALKQFAAMSKKTKESGSIEIYVDGKKVATQKYEASQEGEIVIDGLEKHLKPGVQGITVKFAGVKEALPYSIDMSWSTNLPAKSKECVVELDTRLAAANVKQGETVRLTTTVKNKTDEGQPMTLAIVGIPGGLSAQPWQLKELQEKGMVDFYEVIGSNVVFYFRDMEPSEIHTINLDLKAEIPGTFEAPASSAYLYYTSELKDWEKAESITILKE